MKVMIDTSIIISAALNPQGTVAMAFIKALTPPYQPVICDYIVDELRRKFREKFPKRLTELEAFLFNALRVIRIVPTPEEEQSDEKKIRVLCSGDRTCVTSNPFEKTEGLLFYLAYPSVFVPCPARLSWKKRYVQIGFQGNNIILCPRRRSK